VELPKERLVSIRELRVEVRADQLVLEANLTGPQSGRHSFISHALAGGRTIAEVRAAAGRASLLTTSVYLHVAVDDDGEVGKLFAFGK